MVIPQNPLLNYTGEPTYNRYTPEKNPSFYDRLKEKFNTFAEKGIYGNTGMTLGDIYGALSNFDYADKYSGLINQGALDSPNTNHFKNFGADSLATINDMKTQARQGYYDTLANNELNRAASISNSNNNARSINTQRAMNALIDNQKYQADRAANLDLTNQLNNINAQQAQQQSMNDRLRMYGEEARDTANRQDRANYYMNLIKALNAKNKAKTSLADIMNAAKEREFGFNTRNNTYKDVAGDASGNIYQKNTVKRKKYSNRN